MSTALKSAVLLLLLLPGLSTAAQSGVVHDDTFLLLVTKSDVPGANGSKWVTETFAHNQSDEVLQITAVPNCGLNTGCTVTIPPLSTIPLPATEPGETSELAIWSRTDGVPGTFKITSFVRNVGSDIDPWGTALPIPRPSDLRPRSIFIAPVPADPAYRVSLRAVSVGSEVGEGTAMRVEILTPGDEQTPQTLIDSFVLSAAGSPDRQSIGLYLAHDVFSRVADRNAETRYAIRMTVESPANAEVWGFASLTHNESQHVTVFAP